MGRVYVKFPKVGLGNMMLVWARAIVFSRLNNIPCTVAYWWGFRLGPFIRREKQKRLYWRYFKETSFFELAANAFRMLLFGKVYNPDLHLSENDRKASCIYVFDKFELGDYLFQYIENYSQLVKDELINILHPRIKRQYDSLQAPVISIHIRRGDFKIGNPLTPNSYFTDAIRIIRETAGAELPVTVFTDAEPHEIEDVLSMPGVNLSDNQFDILDILMMGQSRFIVLSRSSTFSYWGAFLSDALVIRHPDWQKKIKNREGNYHEIIWDGADTGIELEIRDAVKGRARLTGVAE